VKVAVLSGGTSSEHDVSLASGAAVREGVAEAGHEVIDVFLTREGAWVHEGRPVTVTPAGGLLGADVAMPVLHGPGGEDGTVQGLLEVVGVPYVGSGVLASALCMDKVVFKEVLASAGVPQVDYVALRPGDDPAAVERLGLPVFVKPARAGSSIGIVKVAALEDLPAALATAFAYDSLVIAEAMSDGIEVECAVLGNAEPEASVPGEIVLTGGAGWYDYEAKYADGGMELVIPPRLPAVAIEEVRRLAVETFVRTGCAGLARVDFFVEGDRILVNELNTLPGFTPTSVYASLWAASGIPFAELCDRLIQLALSRS
jgi:D-alanine-D-alanine ligase